MTPGGFCNEKMPVPRKATDTWEVERGSDFEIRYQFLDETDQPYPLTNAAVIAQLRSSEASPQVLLELSTANGHTVAAILPNEANGRFVLEPSTATLTARIPAAVSAPMSKNGIMDVQLVWPDGTRYDVLRVCVNFIRGTTR